MEKGVILNKNHITEVIFRLEFSTIDELFKYDENVADLFINQISDKFPIIEKIPNNKLSLKINVGSGETKNLTNEPTHYEWVFKNKENNKFVTLSPDTLILEYKKGVYEGFNKFLDEILLLLDTLKNYNPKEFNFLGLRYINQIVNQEINENIGEYINRDFVNKSIINNLEENDEELIQIFTKLNAKKDNYLMTIQYGKFNPKFPNKNDFKPFILDFDCVTHDIKSIDDVKSNLINMNHLLFKKFDYSITSKFEELMKGENNGFSN
jgi:uncharacterized protein (TIGR04255 family)